MILLKHSRATWNDDDVVYWKGDGGRPVGKNELLYTSCICHQWYRHAQVLI
jgi:hypothetical protein